MTRQLLTVNPEDSLTTVREIFRNNRIHHVPVVRFRRIVGLISIHDLNNWVGALERSGYEETRHRQMLEHTRAEEVMSAHLATLEPDDRINVALEIFLDNRIHALPVVENGELVGILTPFDLLKTLAQDEPEHPEDVYDHIDPAFVSGHKHGEQCQCAGDCTDCKKP